jgi:L-asparaginase
LFCFGETLFSASPTVGVAVLHATAWAPGDSVREGAGEFEVLLRVAQLQRAYRLSGVVSVGNQHGVRPCGGERALKYAALSGIPVVKLARDGAVAPSPGDIFVDAGSLSAEQAKNTLEHCLLRYGAPPAAADPENPSELEFARIRAHLVAFRKAFQHASGLRVAVKQGSEPKFSRRTND